MSSRALSTLVKRWLSPACALVLATVAAGGSTLAADDVTPTATPAAAVPAPAPGMGVRLLVALQPFANARSVATQLHPNVGARHLKDIQVGSRRLQVVEVAADQRETAIATYRRSAAVAEVAEDRPRRAVETPNDPSFTQQWGLATVGAANAWNVTHGSPSVVVAVLDTGIAQSHPDLASKVLSAQSVDFTGGNDPTDVYGHGTHVAGIIAAATNNGLGVAGLGRDTMLLNLKMLDNNGDGFESDEVAAIRWAADHGVKVINMSLGGTGACDSFEQGAIDYAWGKGVVIVAAAGNGGSDGVGDLGADSPANCNHVISVAATGANDVKAGFSNYGPAVTLAAPGVSIYSTVPIAASCTSGICSSTGYRNLSGTSMATPMVSGLAALVWTTGWGTSNQAVMNRLTGHADRIGGTGSQWQSGRINAVRAVGVDSTDVPTGVSASYNVADQTLSATWSGVAGAAGYEYALGTTSGNADVVGWTASGVIGTSLSSHLASVGAGTYQLSMRARDVAGNRSSASTSAAVAVTAATSTPTATSTPEPPTATATVTPIPPTATAAATPALPTLTSTATPVPPTATPLPPTATATSVPPTVTATATVTPTATVPPVACSPRPPVRVTVARVTAGVLRVDVQVTSNSGTPNTLQRVEVQAQSNTAVVLPSSARLAGPGTVPFSAGATSAQFTVQQVTPGAGGTVHLVVTDACGSWPTFVGGGSSAF